MFLKLWQNNLALEYYVGFFLMMQSHTIPAFILSKHDHLTSTHHPFIARLGPDTSRL